MCVGSADSINSKSAQDHSALLSNAGVTVTILSVGPATSTPMSSGAVSQKVESGSAGSSSLVGIIAGVCGAGFLSVAAFFVWSRKRQR